MDVKFVKGIVIDLGGWMSYVVIMFWILWILVIVGFNKIMIFVEYG